LRWSKDEWFSQSVLIILKFKIRQDFKLNHVIPRKLIFNSQNLPNIKSSHRLLSTSFTFPPLHKQQQILDGINKRPQTNAHHLIFVATAL
jgi:hypothetical protein